MYSVTRKYAFDAAHQLEGHEGKCARPHGHTYHLEVIVSIDNGLGTGGSSDGMVMDFGDIDKVVKERVLDVLDHRFIIKGDEALANAVHPGSLEGSALLEVCPQWFAVIGMRTTAENLAYWIWSALAELRYATAANFQADMHVRLWETEKSSAVYGA